MNFQELAQTLPNGFHDSELRNFEMDYVHRRFHLDLDVWIGEVENVERREFYRPARLSLDKVAFLIIEPPDTRYDWLDPGSTRIDAGAGCPKQSSCSVPPIPAGSFSVYFYLGELNSFLHVAAEHASLEWTGLEENRTQSAK